MKLPDAILNCYKKSEPETHERRTRLKKFAARAYKRKNRCEILVSIIAYGIDLVKDHPKPAKTLIGDLKAVLIGRNMTLCRGKGAYFAGQISGSEGFKMELRDPWNQIQHATAGLVIAFQYGRLAEILVKFLEHQPQDDKLYDVTFPLGNALSDSNLAELPEKVRKAIGDT